MGVAPSIPARRIAGFGLISPDADRLAEFYVTAFGARPTSRQRLAGDFVESQWGVAGGAVQQTLHLGREIVYILEFDSGGLAYPDPLSPLDTTFQHFAIVVADMDRAMAHLRTVPGWTPISTAGPQRLPERSGGVTAFKCRDPDGHPLELLQFPADAVPPHWREQPTTALFLGIDHSAISISDTAISVAFYQSLGFTVSAHTFNHGLEQTNLDGIPDSQVEVTALSLETSPPHLELLCYRSAVRPLPATLSANDVAATRIVLDAPGHQIADPDGHYLLLNQPRGELR